MRSIRVVAQCETQALEGGVETSLEIDMGALRPQPVAQVFTGHDLAGTFQELHQDEERLLLKLDGHTLAGEPALGQIHLEEAKPTDLRGNALRFHAAHPVNDVSGV